jgi:hypothetical protein
MTHPNDSYCQRCGMFIAGLLAHHCSGGPTYSFTAPHVTADEVRQIVREELSAYFGVATWRVTDTSSAPPSVTP